MLDEVHGCLCGNSFRFIFCTEFNKSSLTCHEILLCQSQPTRGDKQMAELRAHKTLAWVKCTLLITH